MDDSLPIWVSLNDTVRQCDCCGRKHMKRTFEISGADINPIHLGHVCAGEWFKLNLTGNKYKARARLANKINSLSSDEVSEIIEDIKEAATEW